MENEILHVLPDVASIGNAVKNTVDISLTETI